jgi:hypothetical protein
MNIECKSATKAALLLQKLALTWVTQLPYTRFALTKSEFPKILFNLKNQLNDKTGSW